MPIFSAPSAPKRVSIFFGDFGAEKGCPFFGVVGVEKECLFFSAPSAPTKGVGIFRIEGFPAGSTPLGLGGFATFLFFLPKYFELILIASFIISSDFYYAGKIGPLQALRICGRFGVFR